MQPYDEFDDEQANAGPTPDELESAPPADPGDAEDALPPSAPPPDFSEAVTEAENLGAMADAELEPAGEPASDAPDDAPAAESAGAMDVQPPETPPLQEALSDAGDLAAMADEAAAVDTTGIPEAEPPSMEEALGDMGFLEQMQELQNGGGTGSVEHPQFREFMRTAGIDASQEQFPEEDQRDLQQTGEADVRSAMRQGNTAMLAHLSALTDYTIDLAREVERLRMRLEADRL